MKIADNNQKEEYKAFLKNIREEKEETSNIAKLLFTIVLAVLCAVIVCVTLVENNFFMGEKNEESFISHKQRKNFEVPFSPRRHNILLLGGDSNGAASDIW